MQMGRGIKYSPRLGRGPVIQWRQHPALIIISSSADWPAQAEVWFDY